MSSTSVLTESKLRGSWFCKGSET